MTYPPQQNPYGAQQGYGAAPTLASWGARVGGNIIDGLVVLPFILVAVIVVAVAGVSTDPVTNVATTNAGAMGIAVLLYVLAFVTSGYNRWFLAGKTGQSWGKKALGLKLVGEATGQPIGAGMAFIRDLAHFVDGIICNIGYLFPLWDAKKQTIADKLVKTLVIK